MSTLSLRLPTSLHRQLKELATQEGVSMNQLISSAVGEKLSVLMTATYLEERAQRGSRKAYRAVLRKVKDVAPAHEDAQEESISSMQRTRPARATKPRR